MSRAEYTLDKDLTGRIMSIEQRLKGLQGRTAAIEARLSCTSSDRDPLISCNNDNMVFFPAPSISIPCQEPIKSDARSDTNGSASRGNKADDHKSLALYIADAPGIVTGVILVGVGLLIYTGNIDLIKNPLFSITCGIFFILLSFVISFLLRR